MSSPFRTVRNDDASNDAPGPPNVLLITADHWPGSLLGSAGHPSIQTPTLDQLATCGVRFPRAYSECPVCIPARRTLMTGMSPRSHGDRSFVVDLRMPRVTMLAQAFRDAGYQAYASGKLHVYPPRDRVGFDDVWLCEEGRTQYGFDDYEVFLAERGYPGRAFMHGMSNNDYVARPWHLPEDCHPTNWITEQMCRLIRRRDPTRPGFWFLSYTHPHPPLVPPHWYLDVYRDIDPGEPLVGDWARDYDALPYAVRARPFEPYVYSREETAFARRAFYALCTHIDHQIRLVLGTMREEGLLDNTVILFSADHGDMLGSHGLWKKRLFYEDSACVPMILVGPADDDRVATNLVDTRLVAWQDIMPTLLDLAGVEVPHTVDGLSMAAPETREQLYGEYGEDELAIRMLHDGRYKLIYYPAGNRVQLFDLDDDPRELNDLAASPGHRDVRERLEAALVSQFYGGDEGLAKGGRLAGLPEIERSPRPNRDMSLQRGLHWPPPQPRLD